MKAVYITEHGGTEVLQYGDLPEPTVGPNEVKVRVRAAALNRLDVFTRLGVRGTRRSFDGPHVLGGDAAGDVVEVGGQHVHARGHDLPHAQVSEIDDLGRRRAQAPVRPCSRRGGCSWTPVGCRMESLISRERRAYPSYAFPPPQPMRSVRAKATTSVSVPAEGP